jgi:hypothetical protein
VFGGISNDKGSQRSRRNLLQIHFLHIEISHYLTLQANKLSAMWMDSDMKYLLQNGF